MRDDDDRPDKTVHEPHAEMLAAIRSEVAAKQADGAAPLEIPVSLPEPTRALPALEPTKEVLRPIDPTRVARPLEHERFSGLDIALLAGAGLLALCVIAGVYFYTRGRLF